jgi:hypothetical protein
MITKKNSNNFSKITQTFCTNAVSLKGTLQFLCLILFLAYTKNSQAQEADDYAFATNTNSSLADMTGSTEILGSGSFEVSSKVTPLGFDIWFMGVRYTDFSINSNGVIQLGKTKISREGNAYNIPNTPRIAAYTAGGNNLTTERITDWKVGGKIHYKLQGTSPNRILQIECKDMHIRNAAPAPNATFQIWLYETAPLPTTTRGGKIEFRYGVMQSSTDSMTISNKIGFGSSNAINTFKGVDISKNPITASIGNNYIFSPTPKGNIPNLHSPNPNQSRIFTFESPEPNGQAFDLKGSSPTNKEIVLTWNENATNEVGYVIYKSKNGKDYEFLTQVNDAKTFTDTDVLPCTDYFYRVYTVTEGKLGVLQPTGSLTYQINVPATLNLQGSFFACPTNPSTSGEITVENAATLFREIIWVDNQGNTVGNGESFSPKVAGNYTVIATKKDECKVNKNFVVTDCCPVVVEIPTAFTPFSTPSNNIFKARVENVLTFTMKIFNRWGIQVFDSNNPANGWNGTNYDGTKLQPSVYQVVIEYSGCINGIISKKTKTEVVYLIE